MKHNLPKLNTLAGLLFIGLLSACSPSLQYDVLVENQTSEVLNIIYKTEVDRRGAIQEVIPLKPKEQKRIISSVDLKTKDGSLSTSADHCNLLAEFVEAVRIDGTKSSIKWCDPGIRFEKVDIQQGEFTIIYTEADF